MLHCRTIWEYNVKKSVNITEDLGVTYEEKYWV